MPHPQMKVRAVIFDLDETLIEEETSNDASALAAAEIAVARHGVDRGALLTALRMRSRELFLSGPMIDYCRDIGISAREALWGSFTGDDSSLVQLRNWMPTYRLHSWTGALEKSASTTQPSPRSSRNFSRSIEAAATSYLPSQSRFCMS